VPGCTAWGGRARRAFAPLPAGVTISDRPAQQRPCCV